jgi:fibronectin-binding autotransporter adhesin
MTNILTFKSTNFYKNCLAFIFLAASLNNSIAQTNTAQTSGNWTDASIWSLGVPQAGHNVVIASGINVDFNANNATCASLTIESPATNITENANLIFSGNGTLNVSGNVEFAYNAATGISNITIDVANGTLNCTGDINMITGFTARLRRLLLNNGTINCNNFNFSSTGTIPSKVVTISGTGTINATGDIKRGGTWAVTNNGIINVGGDFEIRGTEFSPGMGTVNFTKLTGGQTLNAGAAHNFYNVNFQNTSGENISNHDIIVENQFAMANSGSGALEIATGRVLTINGTIQCNNGSIGWTATSTAGRLNILGSEGSAGVVKFTLDKFLPGFTMNRTGTNPTVTFSSDVRIGINNGSSTTDRLRLISGTVIVNNNSTITLWSPPSELVAYQVNDNQDNYFALTPGSALRYERTLSAANTLVGNTLKFPIGPQGTVNGYRGVEILAGGANSAIDAKLSFSNHSGGAVSATNVPTAGNNRSNYIFNLEILSGGFGTGAPTITMHYANSDFNGNAPAINSVHPYSFSGNSWTQQVQSSNQSGALNRITKNGFALNTGTTAIILGLAGGSDLIGAPTNFTRNGLGTTGNNNWYDATNWVENAVPNAADANVTINYSGTNNPSLSASVNVNTITLTEGNLSIAAGAVLNVSSNINVSNATLSLATTGIITGQNNSTFVLGDSAIFITSRTATPWFPENMNTTISNSSSVTYGNATGTYTLDNTVPQNYGNLQFGSNVILPENHPITINGNLTINSARTLNSNGNIVTVKGNITNGSVTSSTFSGTGKILLNGGNAHTISGGQFTNLDLNDAAGATILGTTTINNTLTLSAGFLAITAGATRLEIKGTVNSLAGTIGGGGRLEILGNQGGNAGTLNFSGTEPQLDRFTMNRTGENAGVTLGTNLTINGATGIQLNNGTVNIGTNTLTYGNSSAIFTAYTPNALRNNYIAIAPGGYFQWNASAAIGTAQLKFPVGPAGDVNGFRGVYITPSSSQTVSARMGFINHSGGNNLLPTNIPANTYNRAKYILNLDVLSGNFGTSPSLTMHYQDSDFNLQETNIDSVNLYSYFGAAWNMFAQTANTPGELNAITSNGFVFNLGENAIGMGYEVDEIIDPTIVSELANDASFILFPNPSQGTFQLELQNDIEIRSIKVYNLMGQLIYQEQLNSMHISNYKIDISDHKNGIYYLSIETPSVLISKKLILSK